MDENIQALKTPVYQPCGGCGATEPGQRCIGCLHDFGSPSANIDPYKESVAVPAGIADEVMLRGDNPEPFALTFSFNSETVGVLRFKDGVATFEGEADESAQIFIGEVITEYDGLTLMNRKRNQELLEANNRYLERARTAEAKLKEAEALIRKIAEQKIEELNKPTPSVVLTYTNYRGETADRKIIPSEVWFGSTEWHPEPQWLLRAYDCEKKADRDFALKDFGKPAPAKQELTDKVILAFASERNIYTRASASVPDLKTGGYRHPFTITISADQLRELFALYPLREEGIAKPESPKLNLTADINNTGDGWVQVTLSGEGVNDLAESDIERAFAVPATRGSAE